MLTLKCPSLSLCAPVDPILNVAELPIPKTKERENYPQQQPRLEEEKPINPHEQDVHDLQISRKEIRCPSARIEAVTRHTRQWLLCHHMERMEAINASYSADSSGGANFVEQTKSMKCAPVAKVTSKTCSLPLRIQV